MTLPDLQEIDARIITLLPETYRESYEKIRPVSMGSAGLKYDGDGRVAWNQIWGSFCHLAMAGGPPHKGTLLEPGSKDQITAEPDRYREVVAEVCRGVSLVTGLCAEASGTAGWVRVYCTGAAMAGWLARAIVMENISAHFRGLSLYLPAGPSYRIGKEIKNVITAIAKTTHYWADHLTLAQQDAIADLFREIEAQQPVVQPSFPPKSATEVEAALARSIASSIAAEIDLSPSDLHQDGWLGLNCIDTPTAIRMMRTLMTLNVFARREEQVLFVALNATSDPDGTIVSKAVIHAHRYAMERDSLI